MPLLQMKHICKSFSGVYANEDINLTVEKGRNPCTTWRKWCRQDNAYEYTVWIISRRQRGDFWKDQLANFTSPKEAIAAGVGCTAAFFSGQ